MPGERASSEPAWGSSPSRWGSSPLRAEVTYSTSSAGPPNTGLVGCDTGSCTTRSTTPSGVYRTRRPAPNWALHTHPSASTAIPSGKPGGSTSTHTRRRTSSPLAVSTSQAAITRSSLSARYMVAPSGLHTGPLGMPKPSRTRRESPAWSTT
jgi:hypothetical protein